MMKIAYFPNAVARNGHSVLDAVLDSARIGGMTLCENSWDADAAVIWSVLWNGRMASNQQVYEHYRKQNKPVIVLDVGALRRDVTWKLAVNHITSQGYYGHQINLDEDRPRKLGITLEGAIGTNPSVLIACQHQASLAAGGLKSIESWVCTQVQILRNVTDRNIIVRPHPRSPLDRFKLPATVSVQMPVRVPNTYDAYNLEFRYHAVVNYNSGPGIQAAIAGVRPVVDSTSLAYPVAVDYTDIEQPYYTDRHQWLTEICHTEYTVDELRRGTWIRRIEPALTVPA